MQSSRVVVIDKTTSRLSEHSLLSIETSPGARQNGAAMKLKRIFLVALMLLVGLPVLLALAIVTTVHFLDKTNNIITSSGEKRE
jgi:hypothetical protein